MSMSNGTEDAALSSLGELIEVCRTHREVASLDGREGWVQNWDMLALSLDAVRTRLVQEGEEYLPVAWAFVDSGRLTITRYMIRIARRSA